MMTLKSTKQKIGRYCKRNSKGKKAVVKPNNGGQNTSSQYVATFSAKNQPFREPQTWYNVPALYNKQPMLSTSGYQRRSQQQGACYVCGSFQNWRSQCPFIPRPAMSKPK
jgi:hypothetical protein